MTACIKIMLNVFVRTQIKCDLKGFDFEFHKSLKSIKIIHGKKLLRNFALSYLLVYMLIQIR